VRTWRNTLAASLRASAQLRLKAGSAPAARALVERALLVDPLDEETVTLALEVALAAGDLERAKSTFLSYKTRLASELSTTPGPALLERYGNVLKARAENRTTELTGRELEILALIGRGRSNKQIAGELKLSTWTVNGHVARILRKMRVESRAAAVAAAGGLLDT
jgi:DNA-binding CsgD family transcriptional regulator